MEMMMKMMTTVNMEERGKKLKFPIMLFFFLCVVNQSSQVAPAHLDRDEKPDFIEYCSFETFNVSCGQNEVLLIKSARYGRMRIGGCIKASLGYIDCFADVKQLVDLRCTGRRQCSIPVADDSLRMTRPCPSDVTWNLEVSHMCVRVLTKEDSKCHPDGTTPSPPLSSGFISSIVPAESHYGRHPCPWLLSVQRGRKIRLNLVGYYTSSAKIPRFSDTCIEIGNVMEEEEEVDGKRRLQQDLLAAAKKSTMMLCGGDLQQKDRTLYLSHSSKIALTLTATTLDDIYLITFEALGCPTQRPPDKTWSQVIGDKLIVKCNDTNESWSVVCRGSQWIGTIGNCTAYDRWKSGQKMFSSGHSALPLSILIAVAVGVALGIFIGGALLALVGSRMNRRHKSRLQDGAYATATLMTPEGKYADSDDVIGIRRAGVMTSVGDYACNSLREQTSFPSDERERTTYYRPGHCTISSGANSPYPGIHHHPYESPMIIT